MTFVEFLKPIFCLSETMKDFKEFVMKDPETQRMIHGLKEKVETFARGFNMPGYADR